MKTALEKDNCLHIIIKTDCTFFGNSVKKNSDESPWLNLHSWNPVDAIDGGLGLFLNAIEGGLGLFLNAIDGVLGLFRNAIDGV